MKISIIYITNPTEAEAEKIAKHLLDRGLIACANILPSKSMYWWKENLEQEKEFVLLAKTLSDRYNKIQKEVVSMHSYDTPCILKFEAEANECYYDWLKEQIQ